MTKRRYKGGAFCSSLIILASFFFSCHAVSKDFLNKIELVEVSLSNEGNEISANLKLFNKNNISFFLKLEKVSLTINEKSINVDLNDEWQKIEAAKESNLKLRFSIKQLESIVLEALGTSIISSFLKRKKDIPTKIEVTFLLKKLILKKKFTISRKIDLSLENFLKKIKFN